MGGRDGLAYRLAPWLTGAYHQAMIGNPDYAAGVRRLRELLPAARAAARRDPPLMSDGNALGRSMMPHVTEANMEALLVYPAPKGGWHADLLLRNVPPGLPNTMGSPANAPHRTKREAEDAALRLLTGALVIAEQNKAADAGRSLSAVFLFHDFSLTLPAGALARVADSPLNAQVEYAVRLLQRIEALLGDVTADGLNSLSKEDWITLHGAACVLALEGIFAWPLRQDAPPPAEDGARVPA